MEKKKEAHRQVHPIAPVYSRQSEILILGSFPSVVSREEGFYYAHPQNRFWKCLAGVLGEAVPETVEAKKDLLLSHRLALWDVIADCEIVGSSDSSVKNAVPTNLSELLSEAPIRKIFVNGKTALKYYRKFQQQNLGKEAVCLPSTSAANAAWSLERLVEAWKQILD